LPESGPLAVVPADLPEPASRISVQGRPYEPLKESAVARLWGQRLTAGARGASHDLFVVPEPRVVLSEVAIAGAVRDEGI